MEKTKKPPELQLFNSMVKQKQTFKPMNPGKVGMYVCGITPYDLSHIGHARAYVAFDVLFRYLEHLGYEVTYVRNFTDIDDKIINRANNLKMDPIALSARYCEEFHKDMKDLQCRSPTIEPRVSDHMEQIKKMIAQIIENGCAYMLDGDVYFSIEKFPNYGRLSGRKGGDNKAGERVEVDIRKRNLADFALWKAEKPGEPSWESPWGPGRPGWHIECSAMSAEYLSHKFDIHGGGMDLEFPHHENEIAQSCAACPESEITYWVHNGFVVIGTPGSTSKMSKSSKFVTIQEVTELYHPLALRYFLLGTHYRSPVNYSEPQMEIASEAVFYIYQTLQDCHDAVRAVGEGIEANSAKPRFSADGLESINKLNDDFEKRLSDDLHTPTILNATLQEGLRSMNSSISLLKKKVQKQKQELTLHYLTEMEKGVRRVLMVLGLLSDSPYPEVLQQLKDKALKRAGMSEDEVLQKIKERAEARKKKEFSKSDEIRSDLCARGIALMDDGKEDTIWRPCVSAFQSKLGQPTENE
ncbi:hypothetical protein DM860_007743 [Cuscuta australis]|uniref:cysteine--tRNA ligase n=1 Tax=Cuscuta australis TaxID=267555 RepID=A0A328E4T2_9ASTE|nr:hypothetical protein DM860_007743 [Cuscuta australis]